VITFRDDDSVRRLSAVFGMLALNGLPMPYHPVFNVPRFALASKDRFFLIVFSSDKKYDSVATRAFLDGLAPRSVSEVPSYARVGTGALGATPQFPLSFCSRLWP
jgi:hypothetical protein